MTKYENLIDSKDPRREEYDDNITMLKVIQDLGY